MDKNKSRTDLLAAGRKKLQQYRKKKGSKGNSSKSSSKSGKSGRDTSVSSASETEETTVKRQLAIDGARSLQDEEFYDSKMESIDRVDSVASDIAIAGDLPEKTSIGDIASRSDTPELPLEGSGVDQTSLSQSANDGDSGTSVKGELSTSLENTKDNIHNSSNTMIQREKSSDVGAFLSVDHSSNPERQHGAELVTDVGAMQDVGYSNSNQNEGITNQIEGDSSLSTSGFTGAAGYNPVDDSGNATADKENINVIAQPVESDNTLLTGVAIIDPETTQKRKDLSDVFVPSTQASFASTESSIINDQPREWLSYDSLADDKSEVFHEAGSPLGFRTEGIQTSSEFINAKRFSDFTTDSNAKSLQFREVDLSSVLEGSVVKLSQLAEILQLLGEDELRFLFKSKGLPVEKFGNANGMKIHVSLLHDSFERLKEQLYVTTFSKDALYLQLCEQKMLLDEYGVVNASHIEVQEKNKNLSEEIMRCQNEIQQVVVEREELHRQLQFSNTNVEDFAAKANELQNNLEMSQKEISSLSSELGDCKNLVESLQAENQKLNESFKPMTEDASEYCKVIQNKLHNDAANKPDSIREHADQVEAANIEIMVLYEVMRSENKQLQAEFMNRTMEMDHLDKRCLKPNTVVKLIEEIEHSVMLEGSEIDADVSPSRLASLIYLLVQKFKEANQGINISQSLEMQLSGPQGQVDHLTENAVVVQSESENLFLKHSLRSAEEEIVVLNSTVKEKVAELEQSEQRVSSLREKLSIAVTKGKALISQRDSLKQCLAETSKEMEKRSLELLSKDGRIHELETKLRVYSEAGERMEALELELSYIRNSATALRESFLLKDSVLHRIEEILEDLELPEHFQFNNIIEKIEWLAKSVGENSLRPGGWDQIILAGEPTYSTAGFVGVEALKDDIQTNPDLSDDFRRKYEDLENKFYGLAEQNEMLEQSLMNMNNLVQRWEGLLNGMDMPSQLRSMEPEDKIQWLKTAWAEAQNHCCSLQLEIDNLETYCGSLAADMEDSHKRAFELVAAFQVAFVEKEVLSSNLEILGHENEQILENNTDLVCTNENLQNEVSMFQEQKLQNENAIRRLEELVCDALPSYCTEEMILGREGHEYLENMLGKLVEKYKTLLDEKPVSFDPINVYNSDKRQLSDASTDFEEQNVETLRKKLEDSLAEHMVLKDERDQYMLNNQSALHKVGELEIIKNELEEQLYQVVLESASFRETLSTTLENFTGEFAILKEENDRCKMENQSLLSEVEELEAKKKELEELLNQEELKSAGMRETLNKKLDDCMVELTILKEEQARYTISNQSLHHEVEGLEMKKKELQELLHQEELKSASLQELLNQEEQKSVSFREALHREVEELEGKKKELEELLHKEEQKSASLQELLNQEEQKSVSFGEALGKKLKYYSTELEIMKGKKDELESRNQSLLHEVEELEMKRKELQQLLHQEELKSASLTGAMDKRVQDYAGEMMILTNEKDRLMQDNRSLLSQMEELEMKKKELQGLLNQEEQRSCSLKEKLNLAVRKGKSLVQQRDSMKQVIEELNAEIECLKYETEHAHKAISEYEGQTKNFATVQEKVQVLESEVAVLKNRLEETESSLLKREDSWNKILEALENIDLGVAFSSGDPVEKLKEICKYFTDLRAQMDSLREESRKSKRASELLLAELNEVQERNDGLQEELAKTFHGLSELSREKDLSENARREALEQIEKLSQAHSDKDGQVSEVMALRSGVDSMREDLSVIERELAYVLLQDFDVFKNLKSVLKSFLESGGISDFGVPFPDRSSKMSWSENKVFMTEVSSIRELLSNHSQLLQEEASQLHEVLTNVQRGYTFYKEACESAKQDIKKLQLIEKGREPELHILRGNVSLLYETCVSSISEIENGKDRLAGNALASTSPKSNLQSQLPIEGWDSSTNDIPKFNEEAIRSLKEKLLFAVRDIIGMQNDLVDVGQREMKNTILNLQKEIQEKDVQRDKLCTELVNQIKEAQTNAKNHLHELQQVRVQLNDSQKQLSVMEKEHKILEQRTKELQNLETNSKNLQHKVDSLTDELAAKVQETEALTQALDAQEAEMEDLTNKVASLEYDLQQKNKDLENLETSRAKALKKLSVTVSKFDELHSFSENLLSEVEKLQSQLQERDAEISFLRQEVTRCTNEALSITELSKSSDEVHDLLYWMDSLISRAQKHDITSNDPRSQPASEYKEAVQKKFMDLVSELENIRVEVQKNDFLLKKERSKVEDLAQKEQYLTNSLNEKETQLVMLQEVGDSTKAMKSPSEIVEVEQRSNKRVSSGAVTSQVRSLRKTNSDQVAVAIDVDNNKDGLEEDDKAHGFKSLTTSKFVPRFTRPVSDLVDGLWVSCDRALMRQPALRLCVMMYWAVLHAMLATFFV